MRLPLTLGLDWDAASEAEGHQLGWAFQGIPARREDFPIGAWASSGQCWPGH